MSGDLDTEMQNKEDEDEGDEDENSDDENKDEEDNMETQAGTYQCHLVIYFSYQNCAPSTCPTLLR